LHDWLADSNLGKRKHTGVPGRDCFNTEIATIKFVGKSKVATSNSVRFFF